MHLISETLQKILSTREMLEDEFARASKLQKEAELVDDRMSKINELEQINNQKQTDIDKFKDSFEPNF